MLAVPQQVDIQVVQDDGAVGRHLLAAVLVDVESLVGVATLGPADGVDAVLVDDAVERRLEYRRRRRCRRRHRRAVGVDALQQRRREQEQEVEITTRSSIHGGDLQLRSPLNYKSPLNSFFPKINHLSGKKFSCVNFFRSQFRLKKKQRLQIFTTQVK